MAIRDLLARALRGAASLAETPAAPKPRGEIAPILSEREGYDGHDYSMGEWLDEYHDDLGTRAERVEKYTEMRTGSAPIVSVREGLLAPGLSANWDVDLGVGLPAELDPEAPMAEEPGVEDADKAKVEAAPDGDKQSGGKAPPVDGDDEEEDEDDQQPHIPGTVKSIEPEPITEEDRQKHLAAEIIRANMLRTSAVRGYRMRTTWRQFLGELFTSEDYGFALFEVKHRVASDELGTFYAYDKLHFIAPESIYRMRLDEDGTLLGIEQSQGGGWYDKSGAWHSRGGATRFIKASRLKIRTRRQEGDKIEGQSGWRGSYATYKRLGFMERAEVIDAQKRAIGIPYYKMGPETPPQMRAEAIKQAKSMRAGNDRSFLVTQGGDEVGFVDMGRSAVPTGDYVRGYKSDIRAAAGAQFLGLGSEGAGGSNAVGTVQEPHFNLRIEGVWDSLREWIQLELIEPLHDLNFGPDVPAPTLRVDDLTPPNLDPVIKAKGANLLGKWTGEDADQIRARLKLRPLTEVEKNAVTEQSMMPPPVIGPDGFPVAAPPVQPKPATKKAAAKAAAKAADKPPTAAMAELADIDIRAVPSLSREPTEFESRTVELHEVNRGLHLAESRLTMELRTIRDALVDEAIGKVTVTGSVGKVGKLKSARVERALVAAAEETAAKGRQHMGEEVARQLRHLLGHDAVLPAELAEGAASSGMDDALKLAIAKDVARLVDLVSAAVLHEVLQAMESTGSLEESLAIAQAAVKSYSPAPLATVAREITTRSYNIGRVGEAERIGGIIEAGYNDIRADELLRSEIMDGAVCEPCRDHYDGMVLRIGSDALDRNRPPIGCKGGERCRGILIMVVSTQDEADRINAGIGTPFDRGFEP